MNNFLSSSVNFPFRSTMNGKLIDRQGTMKYESSCKLMKIIIVRRRGESLTILVFEIHGK